MPGDTIGDGAVIGTRTLVTRDVEPYDIVGGNLARMIRKRLDGRLIGLLLEMKWWNWCVNDLSATMPLLTALRSKNRMDFGSIVSRLPDRDALTLWNWNIEDCECADPSILLAQRKSGLTGTAEGGRTAALGRLSNVALLCCDIT